MTDTSTELFPLVAHTLGLTFPARSRADVRAALDSALARLRVRLPDLAQYLPMMESLSAVLFCSFDGFSIEAYLETLYLAAKQGGFMRRARSAARRDERLAELAAGIFFERTFSVELIKGLITEPRLWDWLTSDDAGAPADFSPAPDSYYMLVHDGARGGELLGMFVLQPHNSVMWEIHTCLLPSAWGVRARAAYRAGIDWLRVNTTCRKVIGNIRTSNTLALQIAERCGMQRIGLNTRCVRKNGVLADQWIVGMELENG